MQDKVFFGAFLGLLSLWLLCMASAGYPLMNPDSAWYLPTAQNFADGRGLVNEIFPNKTGNAFFPHPPLFPVAVAGLVKFMSFAAKFHVAVAIIDIFSLLAFFALLRKVLRIFPTDFKPLQKNILLITACLAYASLLDPSWGRPEALTRLFTILAMAAGFSYYVTRRGLYLGLAALSIGLTLNTGVIPGVHLLILGFPFLFFIPRKKVPAAILLTMLPSALLILLSPYSLADIINAVTARLQWIFTRRYESPLAPTFSTDFFNAHFVWTSTSFQLLVFLESFVLGVLLLRKGPARRWLLPWFLCFYAWLFYAGVFMQKVYAHYQLYCMAPFFFAVVFLALVKYRQIGITGKLIAPLSVALFVLAGTGLVKRSVGFWLYKSQGLEIEDARILVNKLVAAGPGETVFVTPAFWPLFDTLSHVRVHLLDSQLPRYILAEPTPLFAESGFTLRGERYRLIYKSPVPKTIKAAGMERPVPGYHMVIFRKAAQ